MKKITFVLPILLLAACNSAKAPEAVNTPPADDTVIIDTDTNEEGMMDDSSSSELIDEEGMLDSELKMDATLDAKADASSSEIMDQ